MRQIFLLRMLLDSMPRSLVEFSYVLMPTVSPADFLRLVLMRSFR